MMNKNSNVFAVFIPDSPDKKTFKEFKEVKEFLNSPDGRKEGTRFKICADSDELDSFYADSLNDEKTPKKSANVVEPVTPYKSLPAYRFTDLRMAIEKKRNEDFDKLMKENPRFLVNTNNDLPTIVQELSQKVSKLKRVTIEIGENVRDQNRLIDDMGTGFSFSDEYNEKLGIVSKAGGKNVLCYLVLFCFFVFVLIYFLAR